MKHKIWKPENRIGRKQRNNTKRKKKKTKKEKHWNKS